MSAGTSNRSQFVTFVIKINGSALPDSFQVISINIEKALNRIASAGIVIVDGDIGKGDFTVSASSNFLPGNEVRIESGYNGKNRLIFEGIVTKQSLRVNDVVGSELEVICRDKAIGMAIGRKSKCYKETTDSGVITKLIERSGLTSDVTSTSQHLPQLVQYYCSDWDFVLMRAEANGLLVSTINSKVSAFKHDAHSKSVLTVTYGEKMLTFDADLDSITQLAEVKASAWNYNDQELLSSTASNSVSGPGNLSSRQLSKVIGLSSYDLQTSAALEVEELDAWSTAQMLISAYSKITGTLRCEGTSEIEPGAYFTLAGMGDRFNGDHLVSSVSHEIVDGNWFVDIGFGLSPSCFAEKPDVNAPPAAGLLPGVQGLSNATVLKSYEDPNSEYRILIELPLFDPDGEGLWARLSNFYSTSNAGTFFLPEVGDEVVVGFLNEDPRYPIILGSLYSTARKPYSELQADEQNTQKAIVTRSGLRILFDDENKFLHLETPGKNFIELSDQDKQIMMQDQNGNKIEMSPSGITISSPGTITVKADQNVAISGDTGITAEASRGDVSTSAV